MSQYRIPLNMLAIITNARLERIKVSNKPTGCNEICSISGVVSRVSIDELLLKKSNARFLYVFKDGSHYYRNREEALNDIGVIPCVYQLWAAINASWQRMRNFYWNKFYITNDIVKDCPVYWFKEVSAVDDVTILSKFVHRNENVPQAPTERYVSREDGIFEIERTITNYWDPDYRAARASFDKERARLTWEIQRRGRLASYRPKGYKRKETELSLSMPVINISKDEFVLSPPKKPWWAFWLPTSKND